MEIIKFYLFAETFIKQKWKNLRTTYARELKKMERHKIHYREAPYVSRWAHTERLCFLKDCLKARGQSRNIAHLQNSADVCQVNIGIFFFSFALFIYFCFIYFLLAFYKLL